jgi:hypothetical protein
MAMATSSGSRLGKSGIPGYNLATVPRLNPESKNLFQSLLGGINQPQLAEGLGLTSRLAGGDQSSFEQLERPAYTALEKAGAQLASRFSGLGSGARHSSAFANALAGEAGELGERLAGQRMGLQRQALADLLGLSQMLFGNQPDEYALVEKPQKQSLWGPILSALAGGLGTAFGGPLGGAVAGGLTSALTSKPASTGGGSIIRGSGATPQGSSNALSSLIGGSSGFRGAPYNL